MFAVRARQLARVAQLVIILLQGGMKLLPTSEKEIRAKIGKKYIESMAVADKSVVKFHGKERVSRYVLALMNVVCCM
jgi:hypothetical protein